MVAEVVETRLETTPVPIDIDETVSNASEQAMTIPVTPFSIPGANDSRTPTPLPSTAVSSKPPTPPGWCLRLTPNYFSIVIMIMLCSHSVADI